MPEGKPDEHVLEQSRAVAAVGLISVVGGIGLALMLGRVLVPIGFAVALAGSLGVFWLYLNHLKSAYRAITKRIPYRGPGVTELVVMNALAVLMMGISIAVFSIVSIQEPPSGRALLEFAVIERSKLPANATTAVLNIQIKNSGTLDAERVRVLVTGHVRSSEIGPEQLTEELSALEKALDYVDRARSLPYQSQMSPSRAALISLQDFDFIQWAEYFVKKKPFPGAIQMSDDDWRNFEQGKLMIYVLYTIRYEDEGHPNSYWAGSHCGYFVATTGFWHNCGANRIDLVRSPRPPQS
jgi:hypothetical protein